MNIIKAQINDCFELTELTKKSKAYWQYDLSLMKLWENELTVTAQCLVEKQYMKAEIEKEIVGYYAYFSLDAITIKLEDFYVKVTWIKKRIGKKLLNHFIDHVSKIGGYKSIILDADPHAEKFYKKAGFTTVGRKKTVIENRYLPIMEMKI